MCLYFEPYVICLAAINMTSVYLELELEEIEIEKQVEKQIEK